MFTSIDKALVGLVMSILFLLNYFFGINFSPEVQNAIAVIVAALTPVLIHTVPNKGSKS